VPFGQIQLSLVRKKVTLNVQALIQSHLRPLAKPPFT